MRRKKLLAGILTAVLLVGNQPGGSYGNGNAGRVSSGAGDD